MQLDGATLEGATADHLPVSSLHLSAPPEISKDTLGPWMIVQRRKGCSGRSAVSDRSQLHLPSSSGASWKGESLPGSHVEAPIFSNSYHGRGDSGGRADGRGRGRGGYSDSYIIENWNPDRWALDDPSVDPMLIHPEAPHVASFGKPEISHVPSLFLGPRESSNPDHAFSSKQPSYLQK